MKKLAAINQISVFILSTMFLFGSIYTTFGQGDIKTVSTKKNVSMDIVLANLNTGLASENPGLRMSTVQNIGKYKISNFEDKLIEMFNNTEKYNHKETIALSLFQIGSLKSMEALQKAYNESNDSKVKHLCSELLERYEEYEKIRTEYFNNLVISKLDNE